MMWWLSLVNIRAEELESMSTLLLIAAQCHAACPVHAPAWRVLYAMALHQHSRLVLRRLALEVGFV